MQSELFAFLPTLYTHKEFQLVLRPQLSERVSSLTSRSLSIKTVFYLYYGTYTHFGHWTLISDTYQNKVALKAEK